MALTRSRRRMTTLNAVDREKYSDSIVLVAMMDCKELDQVMGQLAISLR